MAFFDRVRKSFKETIEDIIVQGTKEQNKIFISDTTLRDGEQAPGYSLNVEEKLKLAKQLDALGVDAIEAGFANSSKEEFEAIKLIAKYVKRPVLTSVCRCQKDDINRAVGALRQAKRWGLSLFLGTSPLLREHSLGKSKEEILQSIRESVSYAKKFTNNIAFGAEDASRTEFDFLCEVYKEAIKAGAVVIGYADTVGSMIPEEVRAVITSLKQKVEGIDKVFTAVHFHDDLGLAVANAIAAIKSGVNIVQCTVNGIGERAGNTALEELVMALKIKKDIFNTKVDINTQELFKTSQLLQKLTNMPLSPNKAIVGKNVFTTEAGIHQAALIKNERTYEIMKPQDVGQKGTKIVFGKHSGRHAIENKIKEMGVKLPEDNYETVIDIISKNIKKEVVFNKVVENDDFETIVKNVLKELNN